MSEISVGYALPESDKAWRELAQSVLDRKPSRPASYVEASLVLAQFVDRALERRARIVDALKGGDYGLALALAEART